jgi:hypothetical protein
MQGEDRSLSACMAPQRMGVVDARERDALRRYYKVRVGGPGGRHVVASVPARCLVGLGAQERMTGAVAPGGELIGISFDLSQVACSRAW